MRLTEIEKQHIVTVLTSVNGHKTEAAKVLGIGRATLYRKMQQYNIQAIRTAVIKVG